ncbi:MAG: phosphatase [Pseudomonadota bacterium]
MRRIEGDLIQLALDGAFDVIVHGCNCFHAMNAGFAKPIAQGFPEALEADKANPYGDAGKLGTISTAEIRRGKAHFTIVNAYTQHHWRGDGRKVSYDAVDTCFRAIAAAFPEVRIGYPMIGAGLAGGDWLVIAPLIETALNGLDHSLVVLPSTAA